MPKTKEELNVAEKQLGQALRALQDNPKKQSQGFLAYWNNLNPEVKNHLAGKFKQEEEYKNYDSYDKEILVEGINSIVNNIDSNDISNRISKFVNYHRGFWGKSLLAQGFASDVSFQFPVSAVQTDSRSTNRSSDSHGGQLFEPIENTTVPSKGKYLDTTPSQGSTSRVSRQTKKTVTFSEGTVNNERLVSRNKLLDRFFSAPQPITHQQAQDFRATLRNRGIYSISDQIGFLSELLERKEINYALSLYKEINNRISDKHQEITNRINGIRQDGEDHTKLKKSLDDLEENRNIINGKLGKIIDQVDRTNTNHQQELAEILTSTDLDQLTLDILLKAIKKFDEKYYPELNAKALASAKKKIDDKGQDQPSVFQLLLLIKQVDREKYPDLFNKILDKIKEKIQTSEPKALSSITQHLSQFEQSSKIVLPVYQAITDRITNTDDDKITSLKPEIDKKLYKTILQLEQQPEYVESIPKLLEKINLEKVSVKELTKSIQNINKEDSPKTFDYLKNKIQNRLVTINYSELPAGHLNIIKDDLDKLSTSKPDIAKAFLQDFQTGIVNSLKSQRQNSNIPENTFNFLLSIFKDDQSQIENLFDNLKDIKYRGDKQNRAYTFLKQGLQSTDTPDQIIKAFTRNYDTSGSNAMSMAIKNRDNQFIKEITEKVLPRIDSTQQTKLLKSVTDMRFPGLYCLFNNRKLLTHPALFPRVSRLFPKTNDRLGFKADTASTSSETKPAPATTTSEVDNLVNSPTSKHPSTTARVLDFFGCLGKKQPTLPTRIASTDAVERSNNDPTKLTHTANTSTTGTEELAETTTHASHP